MSYRSVPGVLAVISREAGEPPDEVRRAVACAGLEPLRVLGDAWLTSWGHDPELPTMDRPLLLSGPARLEGALVDDAHVARLLREGNLVELGRFLPPFAALGLAEGGVRIATDRMGFRQVFRCRGPGWDAVSTSARLLSRLLQQGWDDEAVLLQSQLGWQLAGRTLYSGVTKLEPGETLLLAGSEVSLDGRTDEPVHPGSTSLDDAVGCASELLRRSMVHYFEDADPLLQITGGMDSRLVLSSVPPDRRPGLRAMTLDVPGSADTAVASEIADHSRLAHRVVSLDGLESVSAPAWFERVCETAASHDAMLNPIAKAATDWAEESLDQGDRLGGLGGEIARGFYYTGLVRPLPVTRRHSERLARWRMLANEAVEPDALHSRHRRRATTVALDAIHAALVDGGDEWFSATDDLYYRHRMARWAGLAESVASTRRSLVNPMLEPEFIRVARNLAPQDKRNAQFLGRLQLSLDPALGRLRLEGRPPPEAFAFPGLRGRARQAAAQSRLAARKARQRATGARRPPAGGVIVAAGVVDHLRARTVLVDPLRDSGWFDERWFASVLDGSVQPHPNTVAFMINMLVALDAKEPTR